MNDDVRTALLEAWLNRVRQKCRCVALEIDPRYVDVGVTRWQRATGLAATLDGDGRTFDQVAAERMSGSNGG